MQNYYEKLYNEIKIKNVVNNSNVYDFMEYRCKTMELDFQQYQALYGHVVYKYEKLRNTKLWKISKKIKAKIKIKPNLKQKQQKEGYTYEADR